MKYLLLRIILNDANNKIVMLTSFQKTQVQFVPIYFKFVIYASFCICVLYLLSIHVSLYLEAIPSS